MPVKLHAQGILRGAGWQVPISTAEAWGTGGFSAAWWGWRDGECNTAGNVTPVFQFSDGNGSAADASIGYGANTGVGGAGSSVLNVIRNTDATGEDLQYVGYDTADPRNGGVPFNRWAGVAFQCGADPKTCRPRPVRFDPYTNSYRVGASGYMGAQPVGTTWTTTGGWLWVGHSTYWGWPGALAHIQLWNRQLTDDELLQALREPGSVRDGLTLWLPFEKNGRDYGPLRRTAMLRDPSGSYRMPARFPSTSDGSGFGRIPKLPLRADHRHRTRFDISTTEAPPVPDGRIVLAGDDFTDVDGTNILSHVPSGPDAKGTWTTFHGPTAKLNIEGGLLLPQNNGASPDARVLLDGV